MTRPGPAVDVREAERLVSEGQAVLLDVREIGEWTAGRAPAALHVPLGELNLQALPAGKLVLAICHSGHRSAYAAEALAAAGVPARNVSGGMVAWQAAGLPVIADEGRAGWIA